MAMASIRGRSTIRSTSSSTLHGAATGADSRAWTRSALPVTMSVDYVRVYQKTADGTLNVGYDDISTPPAPTPLKDAANVKALYSNDYTSVAKNWTVGEWNQGTTTVQKELAIGNLAYFNTNFNYLGFQYGGDNDVVDMSDMDYLHFDIYPTSNMTINVHPITKKRTALRMTRRKSGCPHRQQVEPDRPERRGFQKDGTRHV